MTITRYAARGEIYAIKTLLEHNVSIDDKCGESNTPLINAIYHEKTEAAKFLISRGADVNLKSNVGTPPLHFAIYNKNINIIEMLIANNVDITQKNSCGDTALHCAACRGLAGIFLKLGADVNDKNDIGDTPLHTVAYSYVQYIANLRIDGSDIPELCHIKDYPNVTKQYREFIETLLDAGADNTIRNNEELLASEILFAPPLQSRSQREGREELSLLISNYQEIPHCKQYLG